MTSPSVQPKSTGDSSSTATSLTSSKKRKLDSGPKFYAVRAGYTPGIYHSWADCMAQIKGFKGAIFKSFSTLTDAEAFVSNTLASNSPASTSDTPPKYYGVQNGRRPGVYTDWSSAQAQVTGWTKPRYKSFSTKIEAEAFVKAVPRNISAQQKLPEMLTTQADTLKGNEKKESSRNSDGAPPGKKQKQNDSTAAWMGNSFQPGEGPLPDGAEDDFDPRIILNPDTGVIEYKDDALLSATKVMPTTCSPTTMLNIYTDGSSLANGQNGAVAGVGVFFGPGDPKNVSEPLAGLRQTNQRAELTAIQRALDIAPLDRNATIYSDSNYAINCATTWYQTWRHNGWVTSSKKPVENKDLVEQIVNRIDERTACGASTEFKWLKGHADDPGNTAADALAVNGAREGRDARRSVSTNGG